MQQNGYIPDTANAIAQYFNKACAPEEESHYQTLIGLLFAGQE
ncbi:MAG: hypothetical protein E7E35_27920 [Klebsiella sp.]|nr:hypothetical protein [Klebsiella sp.]MDU3361389.1 hypothetical protein [Klebsiella sp.]